MQIPRKKKETRTIRAWLLQNPTSGVLIIYLMLLSRKSDLRDKIKKFQLLSASMQGF